MRRHVCEHVLGQLARVVARDSSIAVAGVQDLYVALCEDESIWGLFKRLQGESSRIRSRRSALTGVVKSSLEFAIKNGTRQRKTTPSKHTLHSSLGGASIATSSSKSSLPPSASARDISLEQSRLSASTPVEHIRESSDKHRNPVVNLGRKVSGGTTKTGSHQRSASLLSANTKSAITAFNEQYGNESEQYRRPSHDEDEFDALVRSGETMKVSLTPSRLKNFEVSCHAVTLLSIKSLPTVILTCVQVPGNRRTPTSPTQAEYVRAVRPTQSPEVPETSIFTPSPGMGSRESPRKPSPMRPHSGPRLVARNASTIKEDDDEQDEELLDGPRLKKESVYDMFAEESKQGSRKSSGSSGKRTVPAVVLGSPPPRDSSLPTSQPSAARKTKRNDLTVDTTDDDIFGGGARKTRSEAQELADFFNSTNPPGGVTAPIFDESEHHRPGEPPKSAKSLKSFMSRMTGKTKNGKPPGSDGERPPMPSSFSSQGLVGLVKRQKSTTSFASSTVTAPMDSQPPSARPYPEAMSAAGSSARQALGEPIRAENMTAIGVAAMGTGSGAASHVVSPEKRMNGNGLRVNTDHSPRAALAQEEANQGEVSEADIEASIREPSRPADSPTIGESESGIPTPQPRATAPAITTTGSSTEEYVVINKADAQPSPIDTSLATTEKSTGNSSPTKPTPSTASHSQFPSDAASFQTADEGNSGDDDVIEDGDDGFTAATHLPRRDTVTAPRPFEPASAVSSPPSVPLAGLAPLRGLLRHATTARECQLLLGAILSQLGVPHTSDSDAYPIDPESRVTAWLLAGREGPIDYPSPTIRSGTTVTAEESVATPTMTLAELRESSSVHQDGQEELAVKGDVEKESETTSMARTSISAIDSVPEVEEAQTGQWAEAVRVPAN